MKRLALRSAFVVLPAMIVSAALAETTIEKMTLQPGESKAFSIEADSKMKIGFRPNLTSEEAKKCENNCIEISQVGGISMASMYGAAIGMKPKDGKIDGALKNLESFPIEVELYSK